MLKLTPYQSIFFYEWIINPLSTNYNIVVDNTVVGDFDLVKNQNSMLNMMNNVLVFKSAIFYEQGHPQWKVKQSSENVVTYFPNKITDAEIYNLIAQPFDFSKDPLVRQYVIQERENQYRIIFVLAHIVIDGISTPAFYKMWADYYNGVNQQSLAIPEQVEKHKRLVDTFDSLLKKHKTEMHAFWEKRMHGVVGIDFTFLKKALVHAENQDTTRVVSEHAFSYPSDVLAKVKSLRHSYRITPYILGQMVLACLLYKITGQKILGISYPVAILEGKDLFYGGHVNTLVIDYRFNASTTIKELIDAVLLFFKELKATKSKYLPVNEIVKYADNVKILDIAFSQTFQRDYFEPMDGLTLTNFNHQFQIDLVSTLLIEQEEYDNKLNFRLRYDKDVLDEALVENFSRLYQQLFLTILDDLTFEKDNIAIAAYPLLDCKQYNTIVHDWNATRSILTPVGNLKDLFEEQCRLTPDSPALVHGEVTLTYHELNCSANQLAHYLLSKYTLGANDLIAICQDRSEHLLISMLAVLKTGAAYVPIDPAAPKERLSFMLTDTRAHVLLTDGGHYDGLKLLLSDHAIEVEAVGALAVKACSKENTPVHVGGDDLAYIIYTSGTTGLPKGVMIAHKGVVNLSNGIRHFKEDAEIVAAGALRSSKCLWYSNVIFDAHVYDLYPALLHGDCVYIVDEETRHDFQKLHAYVAQHTIDSGLIPPVLLDKKMPLPLKALMVGGESTCLEVMKAHAAQGVTVVNLYGPTEITVVSSAHLFKNGDSNTIIGKPIQNTTYYILDENLAVLPVGAIGELYIGGAGVSLGYLNNPTLTAEKFITNPFQTAEEQQLQYNERLYKTGDLVRYLSNGEVQYIGRKDFQVKIRGFRIELGEIERVLAGFKAINQAVVLAKHHANGMKYLAAYYVADALYDTADLVEYLREYLPDYMIPAIFIPVASFPMSPNGKLDQKLLPEPVFGDTDAYNAPNSAMELALCELYADVLSLPVEGLSIDDNFFQLGGDSISAIQLVNKIRQHVGVDAIQVKDVFKNNTVRLLAAKVVLSTLDEKEESLQEQGNLVGEVGLLPIQQWFFDAVDRDVLPAYHHWNQCFMLRVPKLDMAVLYESIAVLVDQHDAFRLLFRKDSTGTYTQFYQEKGFPLPFDYVHIGELKGEAALSAILTSWQANFAIFSGPLFHFGYVEGYVDGSARVHVAAHHLLIDAVSWRIIQGDLQRIYTILYAKKQHGGEEKGVADSILVNRKGTSYRQWVAIVAGYKNNNPHEGAYWESIFKEVPRYNALFVSLKTEVNSTIQSALDASYTSKILRESNQTYATQANDLLLAALALTLQDFIGGDCHYITLEGHG